MKNGWIAVGACTPELRVADPAYNGARIQASMEEAARQGIRLLVFPELSLTGYTCGDLFLQDTLLAGARGELLRLAKATKELDMLTVVGLPIVCRHKLYNCAAVFQKGRVLGIVPKTHIPNYGEFYEGRHFQPAPSETDSIRLGGEAVPFGSRLLFQAESMPNLILGVELCEDLWVADPVSTHLALAGATVIANLSASDEVIGKTEYRRQLVRSQSGRLYCGYIYADAGEGESTTDMVFAGHNLIAENGSLLAESTLFTHGLIRTELDVDTIVYERRRSNTYPAAEAEGYLVIPVDFSMVETQLTRFVDRHPFVPEDRGQRVERCRQILAMQVSGLRKRIEHTRARSLVLGISGGLDSTLALLVSVGAMDRLKRDRREIIAVTMPCFGTTNRTKSNAETLCERLGVTLRCIDIHAAVQQHFSDIGHDPAKTDVTYENSQARERTQILMDIANEEGGMVIGTGDLSELALGWATYNGDHMSMYGVNASIPKTLVRHMVDAYAEGSDDPTLAAVLRDILDTPVSPELLPAKDGEIAQKTEDLVGPYELHDFVLYHMLRFGQRPAKIKRLACRAFAGIYSEETILHWLKAFYRRFFQQQFKRSCLPDGPKVGSVTLSPRGDWRMPSDASAALWMQEVESL
jgi:NAD+ synthase (glutamine-hydrolysing)